MINAVARTAPALARRTGGTFELGFAATYVHDGSIRGNARTPAWRGLTGPAYAARNASQPRETSLTTRTSIFAMLLGLTCTVCATAPPASTPEPKPQLPEVASRTYLQNFKDLALSSCIASAYAAEPKAGADAGATAGGLASTWTDYDPERGAGEINKLIEMYLARTYNSIHGPGIKLDLLKCLDLYHSKDLEQLARRVVQQPARSYRLDQEASRKKVR